ncbi:uncharacterized protein H6S33_000018 [Morchella sextelata]|uniref:uncharacterized protein n=1 Tax=Morchella sextelata TaxID=1174677 RepID=UPI001D053C5A|nr:uncharacterized protein H6S33_000018 [Morchella sextelata]KAH0614382.1 hypothetical protein H6S33_000018 [Morchella sextelata]
MSTSCTEAPRRHTYRVGKWRPEDAEVLKNPVIQELAELIEGESILFMLFNLMFTQVPNKPPYNLDPNNDPQVHYKPEGLVGFPINAILDWPMGTPAGFEAFHNPKVNAQFKKMLAVWATYFTSPASASVLNTSEDGWFGPEAEKESVLQNFAATFVCDPTKEYHGYVSWDDFFTRLFRPGVKPVLQPDDDRFICSACGSGPYAFTKNIQARDPFWIKGQPYSVTDMLSGPDASPYASQFVGGTVYQAFLSALSYHRWHSPVNGTVVKTCIIEGTYYSERIQHWPPPSSTRTGPEPAAPNLSQGYLTEVATSGLIFIQADNPDIGLMCFMAVGMAEVSTCDIQVAPGDKMVKGQEMGMFHFGGSSHCLIFRGGVNVISNLPETPGPDSSPLALSSAILFVPSATDGQ